MLFEANRPNLQVYIKGSLDPVQFAGKRLETDDPKLIKVLRTIEGVKEVEDTPTTKTPKSEKKIEIQKPDEELGEGVFDEKVGENG